MKIKPLDVPSRINYYETNSLVQRARRKHAQMHGLRQGDYLLICEDPTTYNTSSKHPLLGKVVQFISFLNFFAVIKYKGRTLSVLPEQIKRVLDPNNVEDRALIASHLLTD